MNRRMTRLAMALAVGFIPTVASAQHDAHHAAGTQPPNAELTQCLRVQPVIANVIEAAMARAEAARLSNAPTELRAAVDQLEAALRDVRAQSEPCSRAAASVDPHAGHMMPGMPPPSSPPTQAPAATSDPHAGHGGASSAAKQSGDKQMDPVNGLMVDPATAPKAEYQGQTYYFSSEQSRKAFLANPAKFAKKPKG